MPWGRKVTGNESGAQADMQIDNREMPGAGVRGQLFRSFQILLMCKVSKNKQF